MKSVLFLLLTLSVFALNISAQKKKEFVGFKHTGVVYGETLANGAKDLGGGLLSNENYGVSRFTKGNKEFLWLEKISGRNSKGVPDWIVKDVLDFDKLKKNQEFLFSYSSVCTTNGKENLDTVVLAEMNPKSKTYKVLKAWKVNAAKEKFEKISTKKIECAADKK